LKIAYNNIIGHFIEVTPSQVQKVTEGLFIHKQTLGGSIRYTSAELTELEARINGCGANIKNLEEQIFIELCGVLMDNTQTISITAQAIAFLDVISALATLAVERNYARPEIDNSKNFAIINGRHPVVEQAVNKEFIGNDCYLDAKNLWLITGPNMAGKSTFLRQNALICILAQMGSFVPAEKAVIGVVDKIFSRIGSGDDISSGQSTFMVEMVEAAFIVNNATERSLIILDEIGRGTATYDGLSIAWAVIEHIHESIKAKTLFATHYHELTELESKLSRLECRTMEVSEWEGKVIFHHKVKQGKADRSYGIHVAELAGMPKAVIERANQLLLTLESKERISINISAPTAITADRFQEEIDLIRQLDTDALSPREALDFIYQLKNKLN
jgi:DNA mismatch repair protein MutS